MFSRHFCDCHFASPVKKVFEMGSTVKGVDPVKIQAEIQWDSCLIPLRRSPSPKANWYPFIGSNFSPSKWGSTLKGEICSKRCKFVPFRVIQGRFKQSRIVQSVGHLTRKSGVLGLIPGLVTYFRFSFRFFKKGSCQLLAKVCARSTG